MKTMKSHALPSKGPSKSLPKKLGAVRRRTVPAAREYVRSGPLLETGPLPLKIEPAVDGVDLCTWAARRREALERDLLEHGGILFRGFGISSVEGFQDFVRTVGGPLLDYTYRSTPRSEVSGKIYTSTEYPQDQWIPMHNEMAYTRQWPMKIAFFSVRVAQTGGETPIADSRRVYHRIDPEVRERFAEKGVLYVRNYGDALDLPWQTVFQTSDRGEVEAFCVRSGIDFEWRPGDRLRTRQICPAIAAHPVTGDPLWFNQAHLFHVTSLGAEVAESLLATLGEEDLPRNTYYGDGTALEPEVLAAIRAVFREESVLFPWQPRDILLLDNMLTAHGRAPFTGSRKVVVGMAEARSHADA